MNRNLYWTINALTLHPFLLNHIQDFLELVMFCSKDSVRAANLVLIYKPIVVDAFTVSSSWLAFGPDMLKDGYMYCFLSVTAHECYTVFRALCLYKKIMEVDTHHPHHHLSSSFLTGMAGNLILWQALGYSICVYTVLMNWPFNQLVLLCPYFYFYCTL